VHFLTENGQFAFLSPPLECGRLTGNIRRSSLESAYWKFLLVIIELFSLGIMAERKSAFLKERVGLAKKSDTGVVPHQPFFLSEN